MKYKPNNGPSFRVGITDAPAPRVGVGYSHMKGAGSAGGTQCKPELLQMKNK